MFFFRVRRRRLVQQVRSNAKSASGYWKSLSYYHSGQVPLENGFFSRIFPPFAHACLVLAVNTMIFDSTASVPFLNIERSKRDTFVWSINIEILTCRTCRTVLISLTKRLKRRHCFFFLLVVDSTATDKRFWSADSELTTSGYLHMISLTDSFYWTVSTISQKWAKLCRLKTDSLLFFFTIS